MRNFKSRLKFRKILEFWIFFEFLQNRVYFCSSYPHRYTAKGFVFYNPWFHWQKLAGFKGSETHGRKITAAVHGTARHDSQKKHGSRFRLSKPMLHCQLLVGIRGLMINQNKFWGYLFFYTYFRNELKLSKKLEIFIFSQK